MAKQSIQLCEFVGWEKTTVGAKNTPIVNVNYVRKDGKDAGKQSTVRYLIGTLDDNSGTILKGLKKGDEFVVVKEEVPNTKDPAKPYWNLKEFRAATTFVAKPAYNPGGYGGGGAKKEYDTTGIKVGAARNQAIAFLAATKGTNFNLDDVDKVAYEIIKRQQIQEDNIRNNKVDTTTKLRNEENNKQMQQEVDLGLPEIEEELPFDDDIPF